MTTKTYLMVEFAHAAPIEHGEITDEALEEVKELAKERAAKPPRQTNPHYLQNAELYNEVVACLERDEMSDRLARMLQLMCAKYASKGNLRNYSYIEDTQSDAMINLLVKWKKFNPERSTNAFSYFTECIKNSIKLTLKTEKRERDNRDAHMVRLGLTPSLNYQLDHDGQRKQESGSEDS